MKWIFRLGLALILALALVIGLALQTTPLIPPNSTGGAADATALRGLAERHDPRRLIARRPETIVATESEFNLLLALAAQQRPGLAARADVGAQSLRLRLAQRLGPFWLNLDIELRETLGWPEFGRVRLGRLPVPASLCKGLLIALLERQQALAPLRALRELGEQIRFTPGLAAVKLHWRADSVERLLEGLWPEAERERALAYHQTLIGFGTDHKGQAAFSLADVLPRIFTLAQQRSAPAGADAAAENRMALLTLALHASGRGWSGLLPAARAWPASKALPLRLSGRDDFALHWLYSAAIAVAAGGPLADLIGLDKELTDTRGGGSGFSFNDLAADRAGARLGELARSAPLHVQTLLARPHAEELLLPDVSDLPEFLSTAELQSRFGGLKGEGFRQLMARIDGRIATMPLFNP